MKTYCMYYEDEFGELDMGFFKFKNRKEALKHCKKNNWILVSLNPAGSNEE